jgi:hypothetical protein
MYIPDGVWFFVALLAGMVIWKIYGARISAALDQFDRRKIESDQQLWADSRNPMAHFRRSLEAINDKVEPVMLVRVDGQTARAPKWNGIIFDDIQEAEDTRWRHVIAEARAFYRDLDEDFGLRVAGPAPKTAREEE